MQQANGPVRKFFSKIGIVCEKSWCSILYLSAGQKLCASYKNQSFGGWKLDVIYGPIPGKDKSYTDPALQMKRYHITLGASTTAQGKVIFASGLMRINDRRIALEGDKVACPACRSIGKIVCVGPRHTEVHDGKPVALDKDLCLCKCRIPPILITNQILRAQVFEEAEFALSATPIISQICPDVDTPPDRYDELYILRGISGKPISGRSYAIRRANGEIEHGVTDKEGHTHLLTATATSEQVQVYMEESVKK
jgi:uncharacterized Zn-binding protein involved in type VI secretion